MPQRIQRRRVKGWRTPPNAVYVGRPPRWGNPFGVSCWEQRTPGVPHWACVVRDTHQVVGWFVTRAEAVAKAVELFREMVALRGQPRLDFLHRWLIREDKTTTSLDSIRGKDLACWCPIGGVCHADVLLELANREG